MEAEADRGVGEASVLKAATQNWSGSLSNSPRSRQTGGIVTDSGDIEISAKYVAARDINLSFPGIREDAGRRFTIVDRTFLQGEMVKEKQAFVARVPDWSVVVHGQDATVKFVERDQTDSLLQAVRGELIAPTKQGEDHQTRAFFILGAPGSGKSTLARRVAALLALNEECVVADFGCNLDKISSSDAIAQANELARLTVPGLPVVVLLDDPFFSDSGWGEFMRILSRPAYRHVSVLGASPDFLYHRFSQGIFGKQVACTTMVLERPSDAEIGAVFELHGRKAIVGGDVAREFIVVAMEAASGASFKAIIERIWVTLNGGVPIERLIDHRDLAWPVLAYAIACFMHRSQVPCPEPLMRQFLADHLRDLPAELIGQELRELHTEDGWRIFSVTESPEGLALIGSMHPSVARESLKWFPLKALDLGRALEITSTKVPDAIPQLAELILLSGFGESPEERALGSRLANHWARALEAGTVSGVSVTRLVRALRASRPSRLRFRVTLRQLLNRQDEASWLAAWQLLHLTSQRSHPQEWLALRKYSLPWTIGIANLSLGPDEAVEIAHVLRDPKIGALLTQRVIAALRGDASWRPSSTQVLWVVEGLPREGLLQILELVVEFLDNCAVGDSGDLRGYDELACGLLHKITSDTHVPDASRERVTVAVLDWLEVNPGAVLAAWGEAFVILARLHVQRDLVGTHLLAEAARRLHFGFRPPAGAWPQILSALCSSGSHGAEAATLAGVAATALLECLDVSPHAWAQLLIVVRQHKELKTSEVQIATGAITWLRNHRESQDHLRANLLAFIRSSLALHPLGEALAVDTIARLADHRETHDSLRANLFAFVRDLPALHLLAKELATDTITWLADHPGPHDELRANLFAFVRDVPALHPLAEPLATDTITWLADHPEPHDALRTSLLALMRSIPALHEFAEQVATDTITWLADQSEPHDELRMNLVAFVRDLPALRPLSETLATETMTWLSDHPEPHTALRSSLLTLVRSTPALHTLAEEVATDTITWLADQSEPHDQLRATLVAFVKDVPALRPLGETLATETITWLADHPESHTALRSSLLALVRSTPALHALAEEVAADTITWLVDHPGAHEGLRTNLLRLVRRVPALHDLAEGIATDAIASIVDHPGQYEGLRTTLFASIRDLPALHPLGEPLATNTIAWLSSHPEANDVHRTGLLALVRDVPALHKLAEIVAADTITRLAGHPEPHESLRAALLALVRKVPTLRTMAEGVATDTITWLDDHPEPYEVLRAGLLALVREVPTLHTMAEGVATDTITWLANHPEPHESLRAGLLALVREVPTLHTMAEGVATDTITWLANHPEPHESLRTSLLALVREVPTLHTMAEGVATDTITWLANHPEPHESLRTSLLALVQEVPTLHTMADGVATDTITWLGNELEPRTKPPMDPAGD